jgi:hypothetical protein
LCLQGFFVPTKKFDNSTFLEPSGHTPDRLAFELPPGVLADGAAVQRTRQAPSRLRFSTRNSDDSSVGQANRSQNVQDEVLGVADLIWKYFESEIREALLEAQESLAETNDKRAEQLSNGKQAVK